MKGSSQECHNLTSYWTREGGIIHEPLNVEEEDRETHNAHAMTMKTLNDHILHSYAERSEETALLIREMWIESTGLFPLQPKDTTIEKPTVRLYYRAILNASGTASTLSHLHNLVRQELSDFFSSKLNLHINSQLLVR